MRDYFRFKNFLYSANDMNAEKESQACNNIAGEKIYFTLIIFLAAIFRLIRLGSFSFWGDESLNLTISQNLYAAFFKGELIANHPPLPYIFLALWRFIGMGYNEWTMRGLPCLFGVMGVVAIFWFAKMMFGSKIGLLAAFLLAISPFHILHSQDLKEYIYLPFLATLTAGFFYQGVEKNKGKYWFLYGLFAGICCYAEAFAAPFLVVINLWFMVQLPVMRSRFKGWFFSNIFGVLIFLPWLGLMLKRVHMYLVSAEHWWIPWPNLWSVLFFFKTIAFGYTSVKPFFYLAFILFAIMAVTGSVAAFSRNKRGAMLLIAWATLPVAIVFGLSYIGQSIFLIRAMLPYSIAVYILVAVGIAAIPTPAFRTSVILLVALICSIGLYNYYIRNYHPMQHPHRPGVHPPRAYKEAAEHILAQLQEGDLIIHASQATWLPLQWYGLSVYPHYVAGSNEPFNEMIAASNPIITTYEDYLRIWPDVIEELIDNNPRVWFIFSEWERGYLPGNAMSLYRWLDSKYVEVEHTSLRGIELFLYLTPDDPDMPAIMERDEDTGVTSLLTYSSMDSLYTKVMPDANLIERPLEERKGNLELRFSGKNNLFADKCFVEFSVENKAGHDVDCDIMFLHSSYAFAIDSLSRENPTENDWNYAPFWNLDPPPQQFDIGTASGCFSHEESVISREVQIDYGKYASYVYAIFPWNVSNWNIAPITFRANQKVLLDNNNMPDMESVRWEWMRGNDLVLDEKKMLKIEVSGKPLEGNSGESYTNQGYLAFIKEELIPENTEGSRVYPKWPGRLTLKPHSSNSWKKELVKSTGRVDVWVFERNNENGKAYHIFRLFPAAATTEN